jgi:uncharacterized repeat protein (TIGR01451 family)
MGRVFPGKLRKSIAQLAVLAVVSGGALAAFTVSASATKPSCEDRVESAYKHHFVLMCKSGPESAVAGTDITYTLTTYSSEHKSDDHQFQVIDELPEGTTLVNVDGGAAWDCSDSTDSVVTCWHQGDGSELDGAVITVTAHIDSGFEDEGMENCATLTLDPVQPVATADYGVDPSEDCVWTDVSREFDVSIEKTGPASLVVPGDITYTITASNAGPSDSDLVAFTDTLPAGTTLTDVDGGTAWDCSATTATEVDCTTLDGIPGGESVSATVTLSVPIEHAGTALENCATLASDEPATDAVLQSCTSIEGTNVTVKAAEVVKPVTGVTPLFTG